MSHFITKKLIVHAPRLLTVLVWTAGGIGLTAWTINDFIPLLDEYRNNNVDTQVAVVRNETAWPPNLTVCIPYYSDSLTKISDWLMRGAPTNSCMECEALEQRGWDVWTEFTHSVMISSDLEAMKASLATALMRRILNETSNNIEVLTLNRSNFNWNQPLLDAVWQFLITLKTADFQFIDERRVTAVGVYQIAEGIIGKKLLDELLVRSFAAIEIYYHRQVTFTDDGLFSGAYSVVPLESPALTIAGDICFQASNGPYMETFQYVAYTADEIDPPWIRTPRTTPLSVWMDDELATYGNAPPMHAIYATDTADMKCNRESVPVSYPCKFLVIPWGFRRNQ